MSKTQNIFYWITTVLFAGFMFFTAVPDVTNNPQAVEFMLKLGYPAYFIPFIGWAKIAGAIVLLIPAFPRVKEWAYAGFAFDLIGAIYSVSATGMIDAGGAVFFVLLMAVGAGSYILHHKKIAE